MQWSELEFWLQWLIWAFVELDEEDGRLMTGRLDARPKVEMLGLLGEKYLADGPLAMNFFETLAKIRELLADRNFIAHGLWRTAVPQNEPGAFSMRPNDDPTKVRWESFPAERLFGILLDTDVALGVIREVLDALQTSRGKPPQQGPV